MSNILNKITDWLECEVEDLQKYADRYANCLLHTLSISDFINVGKHETAEELLRLIQEWDEYELQDLAKQPQLRNIAIKHFKEAEEVTDE